MLKRVICLVLCLLALPVLCFAEETFTMAGYDGEESTHDWNTNLFFERMKENTGVSFTFNEYTNYKSWTEAKTAMLTGGEMPDVLFKAALTTREVIDYTESGALIDLKPLLPEHAPDLWALLNENPDWLKAITLPSGKIGALPSLQPQPSQNILWINKAWLDELKLDVPTDWESFKAVLGAFKTGDPNCNGKQDEIPLCFLGIWDLKFLSHAFGVVINDYNIYLDDAGSVHYWPLEDGFFDFIGELRALYADGLLYKDGFRTADQLRRVTDEKTAVTYGAVFAPTPLNLMPFEHGKNYVAVEPLMFDGARVYRDMGLDITRGAFAITSTCKDPAAVLKWVNTLYTETGAIEAMVGREGDVYIEKENGFWGWKGGAESITSGVMDGLTIYDTGDMPWLFPRGFNERYEDENVRRIYAEIGKYDPYVKKPFPVYSISNETSMELLAIQNELGLYADEMMSEFIIGYKPLDEAAIAEFKSGLIERGAERLTELWQSAYQDMQ